MFFRYVVLVDGSYTASDCALAPSDFTFQGSVDTILIGACTLQGSWGEAAKKLAEVVDDDTFRSLEGKSKHQLWLELCDIITRHPDLVRGMKVDAILRSGIRKFTDEVTIPLLMLHCVALTLHSGLLKVTLWQLLFLSS